MVIIMNNRGFTLVEMLAVIVILGIVLGIASNGVISYINTSKVKSEKVFVDKVAGYIESYISLNGSSMNKKNLEYKFDKCNDLERSGDDLNCKDSYEVSAWELDGFDLDKIVDAGLVEKDDLINPANKSKCLDGDSNPRVRVFKDNEYVYYYYVDLSLGNTSCDISSENGIIRNIPDDLWGKISDINCED